MLESQMVIACTLYKQVTDEYGDVRSVNPVTTTCWLRQIDAFQHTANRDEDTATAMAWFRPGETVKPGDVMTAEGNSYRITGVTSARRLGSGPVEFIKCSLQRFEGFVS